MRRMAALSLLVLPALALAAGVGGYVKLPGGEFHYIAGLPVEARRGDVAILETAEEILTAARRQRT